MRHCNIEKQSSLNSKHAGVNWWLINATAVQRNKYISKKKIMNKTKAQH